MSLVIPGSIDHQIDVEYILIEAKVSDRYLIDVDPRVFVIWYRSSR